MSDATSILIVDDEAPARSRLREVLADLSPEFPHRIVGEAANAPEALAQIETQRPQIVLMDVQMPGMTGIELARHISARAAEGDLDDPKPMPLVIFVTAFDEFAVEAFEVNALDYLLKPVHPDRLAMALARLGRPIDVGGEMTSLERAAATPLEEEDLISLPEDRRLRLVPLRSIACIEAKGNFTRVHAVGAPPAFIRRTLAQWQELLPPNLFMRLDRSMMIRLGAVRRLQVVSREKVLVEVEGLALPLELRRRAALRLRQALDQS